MKNILITGATGDLGKDLSLKLAKEGYNLFLTSTNLNKLNNLKRKIQKNYPLTKISVLDFDLTKIDQIKNLQLEYFKNFRSIYALINLAGIFRIKNLDNEDINEILDMFKINVISPIIITKYFLEKLKNNKNTKIINLCSSSSYEGFKDTSIYCSTKHALLGFNKSMQDELRKYNVQCISISPGSIKGKMTKVIKNQDRKTFLKTKDITNLISYVLCLNSNMTLNELKLNRLVYR